MRTNMQQNRKKDAKPSRKRHKAKTKKNTGLIVGGVAALALVVAAGILFVNQKKPEEQIVAQKAVNGNETPQSKSSTQVITYNGQEYERNRDMKAYLFLGVDKKGDMTETKFMGSGGQADAIVLLAVDSEKKTVKVFQISRNTMMNVKVYSDTGEYLTTQKMQLALQYAYGDGKNKSIRLMKETVSELLYNVPINGAISMSIDGISTISTLLGGIDITMAKDYTYVDPAFEQGKTLTLTGEQAERFVRYRDITVTGSNSDRMERQTYFMMSLMSQLKGKSKEDTELYSRLMTGTNPYLTTDMTGDEILALSKYEVVGDVQAFSGEERAGESHDEFYIDEENLKRNLVETFYKPINL